MEDSRKGKKSGKKGLQRLTYTWVEETVKKTIVYNTNKGKEKRERKTEGEKDLSILKS